MACLWFRGVAAAPFSYLHSCQYVDDHSLEDRLVDNCSIAIASAALINLRIPSHYSPSQSNYSPSPLVVSAHSLSLALPSFPPLLSSLLLRPLWHVV